LWTDRQTDRPFIMRFIKNLLARGIKNRENIISNSTEFVGG